MLYNVFGQIGYSIDNGDIYEVKEFLRKRSQEYGDTLIGEFWANITLPNLTEGTHNITVYAEDPEGNIGTSKTITFNIAFAEPAPFPTLTITAATIATLTMISLLVYFKKHKC